MSHEDTRPHIQKAKRRVERGKFEVTVDRIEALNVKMENAVSVDFKKGIKGFRKAVPKKALDEAFQAKDYKKIMRVMPWERLQGASDKAVDSMQASFVDAAKHTVTGVERQANAELRWDASNPRTDKYYAARKKDFMKDLKMSTRQNIQTVVQNANRNGLNSKMVADQIVGSIGLNNRQVIAITNFENGLRKQGLSENDIKAQVEDKNELMLEQRAKMIAVSETRSASSAGQQASWEAAMDAGLIPDDARKEWILGWEMACPNLCRPMRGLQVGVREAWELPNGEQVMWPSAAHPNCRCMATLVIDEDA